jgi:hypothetical protein
VEDLGKLLVPTVMLPANGNSACSGDDAGKHDDPLEKLLPGIELPGRGIRCFENVLFESDS